MTESEEKYLKTIFILMKEVDEIRSIDIASALGYSKASVCRAIKNLKDYGYISMEPYGQIELTRAGCIEAKYILERESIVSEFLQRTLKIDEERSLKYAAYVAHILDQETLGKIQSEMIQTR